MASTSPSVTVTATKTVTTTGLLGGKRGNGSLFFYCFLFLIVLSFFGVIWLCPQEQGFSGNNRCIRILGIGNIDGWLPTRQAEEP